MVKKGDRVWYWAKATVALVADGTVPIPAMRLRAQVETMHRGRRMAKIRVRAPMGRATFLTTVPVIDLTMRRPQRRR